MKPATTSRARAYWRAARSTDAVTAVRANRPNGMSSIRLHGLRIDAVTEQQCIEHIVSQANAGCGGWVVTPNLDILRRCAADVTLARLVEHADLVVADGMPLIWASRLQRTMLPQRVAGSTLIRTLSRAAAHHGLRPFLLGGDPGTAQAAASALQQEYPLLRIAGTHCPPIGYERNEREMAIMKRKLRDCQPDIVFVALGFPKQERLIQQLRETLPGAWWLGVGISFSFLAGRVQRAPVLMQRMGLEWLHRLAQEPRRLGRRYLINGLPFACRLLSTSAWQGLRK